MREVRPQSFFETFQDLYPTVHSTAEDWRRHDKEIDLKLGNEITQGGLERHDLGSFPSCLEVLIKGPEMGNLLDLFCCAVKGIALGIYPKLASSTDSHVHEVKIGKSQQKIEILISSINNCG